MAGITSNYLCNLENTKRTASINTYLRITAVLKLQLRDFGYEKKSHFFTIDDTLDFLPSGFSDYQKRLCIEVLEGLLTVLRGE
jgi:hypothetical protein